MSDDDGCGCSRIFKHHRDLESFNESIMRERGFVIHENLGNGK